jgi:hypothetical protein
VNSQPRRKNYDDQFYFADGESAAMRTPPVHVVERARCHYGDKVMSADILLSRLTRVRKTGPGRWVACCPSHGKGSNTALAVRLLPDGRVLLHDFGGCEIESVLAAIGMTVADLFPEKLTAVESVGDRRYRSGGHRVPAGDVLIATSRDTLIAATVARGIADVGEASDSEVQLLFGIAGRLAAAAEVANA